MNFAPILVMDSILLVITVLLAIADRLLVTYGACKITVNQEDEEKEFLVQGGNYLLANLIENSIHISSSCGGKATCGYCKVKVLSGGGPILPTEELFMSREEKRDGLRLACQVKVKNDLEVYIPDYLTTVKNIVKNRTYDPKLRWRFGIAHPMPRMPEERKIGIKLGPEDHTKICGILEGYKDAPGSLVPVLQEVHTRFNYLPEPVLRFVSENLNVPLSEVFRIATFYNAFSLEPRGKYVITVCLGTACHVKGAGDIVSVFEKELGIQTGETTEDMLFTLEAVRCIGCCGLAPVLKVNEDVHGLMHRKKVPELIERYKGA
nr:2Fe-2S iron-sulfur cluster binding domain-containing protein [Desulfobacterales bacterium]